MTDKNSAWRNPWVIGWFAMLAIFLAVHVVMIYLAETNNPGLVVKDYYKRGQNYEKNMLARRARDPGWHMRVKFPGKIDLNKPVICQFTVKDKAGAPVDPDSVTFHAYRPSDARQDFSVPMKKTATGIYESEVRFPLLGLWDTLVSVKHGEEEYNTARRISVGININKLP